MGDDVSQAMGGVMPPVTRQELDEMRATVRAFVALGTVPSDKWVAFLDWAETFFPRDAP